MMSKQGTTLRKAKYLEHVTDIISKAAVERLKDEQYEGVRAAIKSNAEAQDKHIAMKARLRAALASQADENGARASSATDTEVLPQLKEELQAARKARCERLQIFEQEVEELKLAIEQVKHKINTLKEDYGKKIDAQLVEKQGLEIKVGRLEEEISTINAN